MFSKAGEVRGAAYTPKKPQKAAEEYRKGLGADVFSPIVARSLNSAARKEVVEKLDNVQSKAVQPNMDFIINELDDPAKLNEHLETIELTLKEFRLHEVSDKQKEDYLNKFLSVLLETEVEVSVSLVHKLLKVADKLVSGNQLYPALRNAIIVKYVPTLPYMSEDDPQVLKNMLVSSKTLSLFEQFVSIAEFNLQVDPLTAVNEDVFNNVLVVLRKHYDALNQARVDIKVDTPMQPLLFGESIEWSVRRGDIANTKVLLSEYYEYLYKSQETLAIESIFKGISTFKDEKLDKASASEEFFNNIHRLVQEKETLRDTSFDLGDLTDDVTKQDAVINLFAKDVFSKRDFSTLLEDVFDFSAKPAQEKSRTKEKMSKLYDLDSSITDEGFPLAIMQKIAGTLGVDVVDESDAEYNLQVLRSEIAKCVVLEKMNKIQGLVTEDFFSDEARTFFPKIEDEIKSFGAPFANVTSIQAIMSIIQPEVVSYKGIVDALMDKDLSSFDPIIQDESFAGFQSRIGLDLDELQGLSTAIDALTGNFEGYSVSDIKARLEKVLLKGEVAVNAEIDGLVLNVIQVTHASEFAFRETSGVVENDTDYLERIKGLLSMQDWTTDISSYLERLINSTDDAGKKDKIVKIVDNLIVSESESED